MQPLAYFFLLFSSRSVCLIGMEAVVRNDQVIGFIRRADYGFFIDRPIAYGYVLLQGWRKDWKSVRASSNAARHRCPAALSDLPKSGGRGERAPPLPTHFRYSCLIAMYIFYALILKVRSLQMRYLVGRYNIGGWSIFLIKIKYSSFVLTLNGQHIFKHLFFISTKHLV